MSFISNIEDIHARAPQKIEQGAIYELMQAELLIERIKGLPSEKIVGVEDFDEFLWQRTVKPRQPVEKEDRASELQAIAVSMKGERFNRQSAPFSAVRNCLNAVDTNI